MPEIEGKGDNWFISHHQEGHNEVLEVALPSNHRVRLEYVDGGEDVTLKVFVRHEDLTESWLGLATFVPGDLDGIAHLFVKAGDKVKDDNADDFNEGWLKRLWRWFHPAKLKDAPHPRLQPDTPPTERP